MDPYSVYAKQLEYYEYVQKQMSNPVNLTNTAQSSTIRLMAERIFSKTDTTANLYGILTDETLDAADIFGILVELVLYGKAVYIALFVFRAAHNHSTITILANGWHMLEIKPATV